jgi:restriction system protein
MESRSRRQSDARRKRGLGWTDVAGVLVLIVGTLLLGGFATLSQAVQHAWAGGVLGLGAVAALVVVFWLWGGRDTVRLAWTPQERQERLARAQTLEGLLALSPTEFEKMVGECLRAQGYRDVRHTGGAGDLAADLTGIAPDGRAVVVQCKRYAPGKLVGSPEIQRFLGMLVVHHRAQLGLFVTTSSFTQPARALAAQHQAYLQLVDGAGIAEMARALAVGVTPHG